MSDDSAYIQPSERDYTDCPLDELAVIESHAVVDSIAADLAEAVDALIEAWPGVMDGQLFHKAMTASLRFDALKGKAE